MKIPYEFQLGWRYTRSGKTSKKNSFISFISAFSMLGIALGVAALIIILSVMNGFQKEVRDRMLGVISHIEITAWDYEALNQPQDLIASIKQQPQVIGAAPYVAGNALVAWGEQVQGALIRGILPEVEAEVSDLNNPQNKQSIAQLQQGSFSVVIGKDMANNLGLQINDMLTLILPNGQFTPAGTMPRFKQVQIVGLFESGHYEYDSALVLMHLQDATKLFRLAGPSGIRVKLNDVHAAPQVSQQLRLDLPQELIIRDWTQQNKTWFAAVQIEKRMMFIILTLIVAVAAFNLVSTLVMTVTDKHSDIAILRTLGAAPKSIMLIFMLQGAMIGIIGTALGLAVGLGIACNIDIIIPALESLFGFDFLPKDIYLISSMPSQPQFNDIAPVVLISLFLAFIATIYPSWRASKVNPAEALRYE